MDKHIKTHEVNFITGTYMDIKETDNDDIEITLWSAEEWNEINDLEREVVEEIELRGKLRIK